MRKFWLPLKVATITSDMNPSDDHLFITRIDQTMNIIDQKRDRTTSAFATSFPNRTIGTSKITTILDLQISACAILGKRNRFIKSRRGRIRHKKTLSKISNHFFKLLRSKNSVNAFNTF